MTSNFSLPTAHCPLPTRVGIIGAGLQGRRRAPAVKGWPGAELKVITAKRVEEARRLAEPMGCEAGEGWEDVVGRGDIDVILICTPPDIHADITIAALRNGKHVLCEKPLARTLDEAEAMVRTAREAGKTLKCGFNHRHHPAVWEAKRLFDAGEIGEPTFARGRYGIGGRPGYEQEWRADPKVTPGGHLMEQGIHLVDLCRWFLGDFAKVVGFTNTAYWQMAPLEDNGFALLQTSGGAIASLHASLTQWKNLFSFEVFGRDGYLVVDGLGASYGTERLVFGKRAFDKPFSEQITEFRGDDKSWLAEWREFAEAVERGREPLGNGEDGLEALRIVLDVYDSAAENRVVIYGRRRVPVAV